jgi:hypothetical protein
MTWSAFEVGGNRMVNIKTKHASFFKAFSFRFDTKCLNDTNFVKVTKL